MQKSLRSVLRASWILLTVSCWAQVTTPTNVTASPADSDKIYVSWSASTSPAGINHYIIETHNGANLVQRVVIGSKTLAAVVDLSSGTTYSVDVYAVDNNSVSSSTSASVNVTTPTYPAAAVRFPGFVNTGFRNAASFGTREAIFVTQNNGSETYHLGVYENGVQAILSLNALPVFNFSCVAMLSRTSIVAYYETSGNTVVFDEFQIDNANPPVSASLVNRFTLSAASGTHSLNDCTALSSGGFVASFSYLTSTTATWIYRNPSGTWSNFNLSNASVGTRIAVAQHPVTKEIWGFMNEDGAPNFNINVVRMTEVSGGLSAPTVTQGFLNFQSQVPPNREWPWMVARSNPAAGTIVVGYQSDPSTILNTQYAGWSGEAGCTPGSTLEVNCAAHIGFAAISGSGTVTFFQSSDMVERLAQWGDFSFDSTGQMTVAYAKFNTLDMSRDGVFISTYNPNSWSTPQYISDHWYQDLGKVNVIDGKVVLESPDGFASLLPTGNTAFPVNSLGIIQTGLPAAQDNLLGPLIPFGASPWTYGDAAEKGVADNMGPAALAEAPVLGAPLCGTVSFTGGNVVNTTCDLRAALSGQQYVAFAWNTVDGAGTGRILCPISSVSITQITCQTNIFTPAFSGITAYMMNSVPDSHGWTFLAWTQGNPSVTWNYYDVAIAFYRLYYRTGNTTYLNWARQYADITWQWTLDHGYNSVYPRAMSMISQYFRALDGHPERLPYLYNLSQQAMTLFGRFVQFCPYCDNRESGYSIWWMALGAKADTDATRHAAYCSSLTTYVPYWNSVQQADGSFGENEYALNTSFVAAVKSFTPPFVFQGAPWREAINVKSLEAAYEVLNDTSSQGCNNPALAATTLATITKAVTWQNNYGRDTVNRGVYYEVNSQSADQETVSGVGTVSITLTSAALTGVGTNWQTAGYCDGTHFIGIAGPNDPRTVYKIASCADNTHATLSVAFGAFGETMNVSNSSYGIAPAAKSPCNSSATYCYGASGDRNLTRTVCGGIAWLYAQTLNATYKSWSDECVSAQLGGPSAGLTSADNIGSATLPCSGPACDGWVTDTVASAPSCRDTLNAPPCVYGGVMYSNLGKNYGEAFGAPGIDNALAWRLYVTPATGGTKTGGKGTHGGHNKH